MNKKELEGYIEKKRLRVTNEARIREEKERQKQDILNEMAALAKGGGMANNKLRGAADSDFFQKNNTSEKGWTFNFDGTISEFKKPTIKSDQTSKVGYEFTKGDIEKGKLFANK